MNTNKNEINEIKSFIDRKIQSVILNFEQDLILSSVTPYSKAELQKKIEHDLNMAILDYDGIGKNPFVKIEEKEYKNILEIIHNEYEKYFGVNARPWINRQLRMVVYKRYGQTPANL